MAYITSSDILGAFKSSVLDHYQENMKNTSALVATTIEAADYTRDRLATVRAAFNNIAAQHTASNGGVFRNIFREIGSKQREVDASDDAGFVSSGTKEENADVPTASTQAISADTLAKNRTAYDVANIQVKAVVAQTQMIVSTLSDQTTVMRNIDSNIKKLLESMTKGFESLSKENAEAAKDAAMYNEKGYLNISNYFKQLTEETSTLKNMLNPIANMIKNPKDLVKFGFDMLLGSDAVTKLTSGLEESVSKGFTRFIERLTNTNALKAQNPISKALRRILNPREANAEMMAELASASGITGSKPVAFDNITHRTINDVLPGLLERILAQTEIAAQVLQQSSGIRGKASGTTYDMAAGKFSTIKSIQRRISGEFRDIMDSHKLQGPGSDSDIDLQRFADAIEPMIFFMASTNQPINNFHRMSYDQAHNFLLWGLGTTSIPPDINTKFELFWRAIHASGSNTTMTGAQRRAIQQITTFYHDIKRELDAKNREISSKRDQGVIRGGHLAKFNGMNAHEIFYGRRTNYGQTADRGSFVPGANLTSGSDNIADIGKDFLSDIGESISEFTLDMRKLAKHALQEGSIYVHDTVLIEYFKAYLEKYAPKADYSSAKAAERVHQSQHPEESAKKSISPVIKGIATKVIPKSDAKIDTSYADDDPDVDTSNTGIQAIDGVTRNIRFRTMKLAQGAGYKGYDKQLASGKYADLQEKDQSRTGRYEQWMRNSDIRRVESDIQYALESGKISTTQAEELRRALNNSSPDEYKGSLLKTMMNWSPIILGGLAFGPFGALAGIGIRNIIKRNTADRVARDVKSLSKETTRDENAKSKLMKDRRELEEQIQQAYNSGKLSEEEYTDAMLQLSTMSKDEYKGGLMKWAKRLGPAVAAGLLGLGGPLGIIIGAVVGKKLTETTASRMRRSLKKIKPRDDIWDDDKRAQLIKDINKKIEELQESKASLGSQDEKDKVDETIAQLEQYKDEIRRAGKAKMTWYFTSIPGILSAIGNIRHLPKMAISAIGKGLGFIKKHAGELGKRALNKAKGLASKAIASIFYGDPRIATDIGREEMLQEIEQRKATDPTYSEEQYIRDRAEFFRQCEKYDENRSKLGVVGKAFRKVSGFVGAAVGTVTGRTQKNAVAKANRAASDAKKILAGGSGGSEATAVIADTTDQINQNITKLTNAATKGNSLNASDAGTHELLKQILFHLNPGADLGGFKSIEDAHQKESPTSSRTSNPHPVNKTPNGDKVINGKVVHDDTDDQALQLANITAANIDDPNDKNLKSVVVDAAISSADKSETKNKIRNLFDKTYRNLSKREGSGGSGGGGSEEQSLWQSIKEAFSGGSGGSGGLLSKIAKGAAIALGIGGAGIVAQNMSSSFTRDYNDQIETRDDIVSRDMINDPGSFLYGQSMFRGLRGGSNSWTQTGQKIGSFVGQHGKNLISGVKASKPFKAIANSGVGKAVSAGASKFKGILNGFISGIQNNRFLKGLFNFIGKVIKVPAGKMGAAMKTLFNGLRGAVKMFGAVLYLAAIALEVVAAINRQMEAIDPTYNERFEAAMNGSDNLFVAFVKGFSFVRDNYDKAEKAGGDGFAEGITKAIASAGINTALSTAFAPYAIIKFVAMMASMLLEHFCNEETNHNSIKYVIMRSFKFLLDDLLELDQELIDLAAAQLVDLFQLLLSILTLDITKIIPKLKDVINNFKNLYYGLMKGAAKLVVDLLMCLFVSCPVFAPGILAYIKVGGGDNLLSLHMNVEKLLNGEMTLGEFCSTVLSGVGDTLKNALEKAGEVLTGAWAKVKSVVHGVKDNIFGTKKEDSGSGKGRRGRFGRGLGGDLYQENPMYMNSPYDMFNSGCGPIALTAALRQQGVPSDPNSTAAALGGYRDPDGGTRPNGILAIGNRLGGKFSPGASDSGSIMTAASAGKPVVMMGQSGAFGDGMHYMTAVGARGGSLLVRDPLNPNLREVHPGEIDGRVTTAIYGRGGRSGRGFTDVMSSMMSLKSNFMDQVNGLFGALSGSSGDSSGASNSSGSSSGSRSSGNSPHIDSQPREASGSTKSLDGSLIYPQEMCKDPGGNFPRASRNVKYSSILPSVKQLLISQYKYTLVLPTVIACIMRAETEFGMTAHHKNLGNIMGRSKGTKDVDNYITDAKLGHRVNYEAYNYWGESIYRIGTLFKTNKYYANCDVIGNLDALSALRSLGVVYASSSTYGDTVYNYWSESDMNILKQYDKEAIASVKSNSVAVDGAGGRRRGRGRSGRGFTDVMSSMMSLKSNFMDQVNGLFGALTGQSSVDASTTPVGDDTNIDSTEIDQTPSGNQYGSASPTTAITKGSMVERILEYLKQSDPSARISLGYQGTAEGLYSANDRHTGIDFTGGSILGAKIYSPIDGTVERVVANVTDADGPSGGGQLGNNIRIRDKNGKLHWFAHMRPGSVTAAKEIKSGDYIGEVGNTGRSTGPHLHYQISTGDTGDYYSVIDPNSVSAYGRTPLFRGRGKPSKTTVSYQDSFGGRTDFDYTAKLDQVIDLLKQIVGNTGDSVTVLKSAGRQSGRGGNSHSTTDVSQTIEQKLRRMSSASGASNCLGVGFQRLTRGF